MTHMTNIYHYCGEIQRICWWSEWLYFRNILHICAEGTGIAQSVLRLCCGLDGPGLDSWQRQVIFLSFKTSHWLWVELSFLFSGYWRLYPQSLGVKLTAHFCLMPRLSVSRAVRLFPLYAFLVWTGTTVPLAFTMRDNQRLNESAIIKEISDAIGLECFCIHSRNWQT